MGDWDYFVLNEESVVHFLETFHVPGNVVLDVLYATDLEDHELVYGVS